MENSIQKTVTEKSEKAAKAVWRMKMDNQTNKKMTNSERRDAGMAYISDESVFEEQRVCRKILQRLNFMDRSDFAAISEVVKELFGKSDGAFVNPPFYCDYGKHIEVGKNFLRIIT